MTQRSFNNERYTDNKPKGTTRKSASSVKPKREAAGSVTIVTKTKAQKDAEKEAAKKKRDAKMREANTKYYNPRTPEYKRARRIWALFVVLAIALSVASFFLMPRVSDTVSTILIIAAYVCIAIAIGVDLIVIRKIRLKYAAEASQTKEQTRARKDAHAAKLKAAKEGTPVKKKKFLGIFGGKDKTEAKTETKTEAKGEE